MLKTCFSISIPITPEGTQLALDIQSGFKPLEGPERGPGETQREWWRGIYILQIKLYIYARGV